MGKKSFTVAIEGNIGSGKSTLLNHFRQDPNSEIFVEPTDKWRDLNGQNIMGLMYEDPKRWGFAFQSYVQLTMLQIHTAPQKRPVKLMERTMYSARYCFVENLHKNGLMTDAEYMMHSEWFDWLLKSQAVGLDLIVYLQSDPSVCHQRIQQRARTEESQVPMEYLEDLHGLHEEWLIQQSRFSVPSPVVVINGNLSKSEIVKSYKTEASSFLVPDKPFAELRCSPMKKQPC